MKGNLLFSPIFYLLLAAGSASTGRRSRGSGTPESTVRAHDI